MLSFENMEALTEMFQPVAIMLPPHSYLCLNRDSDFDDDRDSDSDSDTADSY